MTLYSDEEPDKQGVFDFYKEVVSAEKITNNTSVDDPWQEVYEAGYRAGLKRKTREVQSGPYHRNGDLDVTFAGV